MSDLHVRHLVASVHGTREQAARARTLLQRVADQRLDARMGSAPLPEGEWCVRRVEVQLPLADDADGVVERAWADAILAGLRAALGGPDVVAYRDRQRAAVDAVVALSAGDAGRAWAWRQLGLLTDADPDPVTDAAGALVAVCAAEPRAAVTALLAAVLGRGADHVVRMLGVTGVRRLAALVAESLGTDLPAAARGAVPAITSGPSAGPGVPTAAGQAQRAAAERARRVARSPAGLALVPSGTWLSGDVAAPWALLIVAAADPAALALPGANAVVAAVTARLTASAPQADDRAGHRAGHRDGRVRALLAEGSAETLRTSEESAAQASSSASKTQAPAPTRVPTPEGDDGEAAVETTIDGVPTEWGGLLFLLNTAAEAGLPDRLADARLAGRPSSWSLWRVARRLVPLVAGDPAGLALAGLDPAGPAPLDDPSLPEELAAVESVAVAWAEATARRLARSRATEVDADPFAAVAAVALRDAVVTGDAGWVEVLLSLTDVDVDVRRAGLDVDPGWLPWLGRVVRFRYE